MTYWKRTESEIWSPISLFDEVVVANRTNLIEIKPQINLVSDLRNINTAVGTGTISIADSEFQLQTGATAASSMTLDSAERGRYQPGYAAEIGLGVRLDDANVFAGTAEVKWGYFTDDSGFGFGKDATGIFVFIIKNGSVTKTYQNNWNIDKVDGSGVSGLTIDLNRGNIFTISYTWYGYGNIVFRVSLPSPDPEKKQETVELHRYSPDGETSVTQPNLPIRVSASNGDQSTNYNIFVAGRQYSIIGDYDPNRRLTSHTVTAKTLTAINGFEHIMSFRRKTTNSFDSVSAKIAYLQYISGINGIGRIKTNASLSGAVWGNPSGKAGTANETALEVDTTATVSGGVVIAEFLLEGGRGASIAQVISLEATTTLI